MKRSAVPVGSSGTPHEYCSVPVGGPLIPQTPLPPFAEAPCTEASVTTSSIQPSSSWNRAPNEAVPPLECSTPSQATTSTRSGAAPSTVQPTTPLPETQSSHQGTTTSEPPTGRHAGDAGSGVPRTWMIPSSRTSRLEAFAP